MTVRRYLWLVLALPALVGAEPRAELSSRIVFTDETVGLRLTDGPAQVTARASLHGDLPTDPPRATLTLSEGANTVKPLAEGLNLIALPAPFGRTVGFLALAPPPKLTAETLKPRLPQNGGRLLAGQPYTVMVLGDSQAAEPVWGEVFVRLLKRATGNDKIALINRGRAGDNAEGGPRRFPLDTLNPQPDLALVMYRDGSPALGLDSYLDQLTWLTEHLASERRCDVVLLQPRRDLNNRNSVLEADSLVLAEALRGIAVKAKVPLAETLRAVWPFDLAQFADESSAFEPHSGLSQPAALSAEGHRLLAKAVLDALAGEPGRPKLKAEATLRWSGRGVSATVILRNICAETLTGRLDFLQRPGETLAVPADAERQYTLAPFTSTSFEVSWPGVKAPSDLWKYPYDRYLAPGRVLLPLEAGGLPLVAHGRFEVDTTYLRRVAEAGLNPTVAMDVSGHWKERAIELPATARVGRLNLLEPTIFRDWPERIGWAAAELIYQRMAGAETGEVRVDADLKEWRKATWSPVGEPCQARGLYGPEDHRATPDEARLEFASRAGADSLFLALKGTGALTEDTFELCFDNRPTAQLCTAGPSFWVDGKLLPGGALELKAGLTSPTDVRGLGGLWRATPTGFELELRVPYRLFGLESFPPGADLGFELWWQHRGPGGLTHLLWSGDAPPPSPRTFGALHHFEGQGEVLPWLVRVR